MVVRGFHCACGKNGCHFHCNNDVISECSTCERLQRERRGRGRGVGKHSQPEVSGQQQQPPSGRSQAQSRHHPLSSSPASAASKGRGDGDPQPRQSSTSRGVNATRQPGGVRRRQVSQPRQSSTSRGVTAARYQVSPGVAGGVAGDQSPSRGPEKRKRETDSDEPFPKKAKTGLVGLNNMGNTCYLNAALQCLSKTSLAEYYSVLDKSCLRYFGKAWKELLEIQNLSGMESFSPTEVLRLIRTDSKGALSLFPSARQHDPSELLDVFLNKLDSEIESGALYDF